MAKALAAARSGFRRFFSISAFTPPPPAVQPPKADPSPNLFVSGLSKRTTTEGLREAFSKFGEIIHAKVVTDRVSGYSKGFGFVRYATTEDANEGIKGMDGKFLDGWVIFAEYARPRPPLSQDQSSQPQSNYGSAPQSNYSSLASHSPSYYTSDATSNFSSQASHLPSTQPPSSNSFYAPQSTQPQSSYYGGSVLPSNYSSQISPPESSHASSYFNHSSQTSQPQLNNGSGTPFNYSSEISSPTPSSPSAAPSWYPSQATQPASYTSGTPNYSQVPPSNYSSQISPPESSHASSYFNHSSQTSQPQPNNGSGPPFNYSSEISPPMSNSPSAAPSWYPNQATQPASYTSGTPNYSQSYYDSVQTSNQFSRAPQQTHNYQPPASDPASGYASTTPNYSPLKSEILPGNTSTRNLDTLEPSTSYSSEPVSEYGSERAVNY